MPWEYPVSLVGQSDYHPNRYNATTACWRTCVHVTCYTRKLGAVV